MNFKAMQVLRLFEPLHEKLKETNHIHSESTWGDEVKNMLKMRIIAKKNFPTQHSIADDMNAVRRDAENRWALKHVLTYKVTADNIVKVGEKELVK